MFSAKTECKVQIQYSMMRQKYVSCFFKNFNNKKLPSEYEYNSFEMNHQLWETKLIWQMFEIHKSARTE